jgi:hypothetical protein
MGIDKSLDDRWPSLIINGRKYHYGREPNYRQYLVENANYAKDYWVFDDRKDLEAFLINLPGSADNRGRIRAAYPDWQEVTPEQRDAYLAEDRASQRALAEQKLSTGAAASYNMDLDGKGGPYKPQRVRSDAGEEPLARVERQLAGHKRDGMPGLSEAGKLRVVEGEIDWTGVDARHKEAVLAREMNFAAITPEQFTFVYQDIKFEKLEPADDTVARTLFDQSRVQPETPTLRPATQNLVTAVMLDMWPRQPAIAVFGIRSQAHLEALYYPLRHGDFTPEQVNAALGNGPKLTELVNAAPHNPHKGIVFRTDWDALPPGPERQGTKAALPSPDKPAKGPSHPWPSEVAKASKPSHADQPAKVKTNGRDDGHSM